MLKYCVFVLSLILLIGKVSACGRGSIKIEDNGYKDILIAIADDVPENPELIERIKYVFTQASAFLYQITRQRAYFQNITILVPLTWTGDYLPAAGERFDKSDIVVELPDKTDQPFTIKTTPCGEYGYFMRLTTDYLLDDSISEVYGPYDKVITHEWSHLRYGVFDEYALNEENRFYATAGGEFQPTKCVYELQGEMVNEKTGGDCSYDKNFPEEDCIYIDYILDGTGYGSLMYKTYLDHITEFCDSDKEKSNTLHDKQAPNLQNKMCGRRSVWEVLRSHPDFLENNPPAEIEDTTPHFKTVKPRTLRSVLVLDVSGSMDGCKIDILGQSCSNYISNIIQDGEFLGIVWFNTNPDAKLELTPVNDNTRQVMLDNIPTVANGGTSIGGGIQEALDMLVRFDGTELGGSLIVVSDGEETEPPYVADVEDQVFAAQVTVHSIAVTDQADSAVDALAEATGGLTYLFTDCATSNAMNEAFLAIGELNTSPTNRSYVLLSDVKTIVASETLDGSVLIDSTLGRNTQFIFDYDNTDINPVLTSPNGTVYNKNSGSVVVHDTKFKSYRFTIDEFESGSWKYEVTSTTDVRIATTIKSQSAIVGQYPIIATVSWGTRTIPEIGPNIENLKQIIYASVSQGYSPVLHAVVEITTVSPIGTEIKTFLYDNGAGADAVEADGIYAGYFVNFDSQGRYSVQVLVNSNEATVINPDKIIGGGAPKPHRSKKLVETPVDPFTRSAAGGSFELQSYTNPGSGKFYPPGEITDLQFISADFESQTAVLTWTAVGEQLNEGQVSYYDLRMGTDFEAMETAFDSQNPVTDDMIMSNNSLKNPQVAGTMENYVIAMPDKGAVTYVFAVKAVDENGRNVSSSMSNIASVSMSDFAETDDSMSAGAIVGIVIGILFLVAIISLAIFCVMTVVFGRNYNVEKRTDQAYANNIYSDAI